MVTNLPPDAKAQWDRVVAARTPEEKLRELQIFYSLVPKHKGTRKLLAYVRRKMSTLREEIEERKRAKVARFVSKWEEPVHGAARISITGFSLEEGLRLFEALSGKSVNRFFLSEPEYGVMEWEGLQFQLALLPPIVPGARVTSRVLSYLPTSELMLFASAENDFSDFREFAALAESEGVLLKEPEGSVEIERTPSGGVRIVGSLADATNEELVALLRSYRISNAVVKLRGRVTLDDVEAEILGMRKYVKCVPVRLDSSAVAVLDADTGERIEVALEELPRLVFSRLNLIRVYTKHPKGEVSGTPITLRAGSTVGDLAKEIHSELFKRFRYAIVWRKGRQVRVSKDFTLEDGDIVEIRAY